MILNMPLDAAASHIKKEFRGLVRRWHPDRYEQGSPEQAKATTRLQEINMAFDKIKAAPLRHYRPEHNNKTPGDATSANNSSFNSMIAGENISISRRFTDYLARFGFPQLLWLNFVASVWIFIAINAYNASDVLLNASAIRAKWGPFTSRIFLGSFIPAAIWIFIWFYLLRESDTGAKPAAFILGFLIIVIGIFIPLIWHDLYGTELSLKNMAVSGWLAMSHFAFAIFWRKRYED